MNSTAAIAIAGHWLLLPLIRSSRIIIAASADRIATAPRCVYNMAAPRSPAVTVRNAVGRLRTRAIASRCASASAMNILYIRAQRANSTAVGLKAHSAMAASAVSGPNSSRATA